MLIGVLALVAYCVQADDDGADGVSSECWNIDPMDEDTCDECCEKLNLVGSFKRSAYAGSHCFCLTEKKWAEEEERRSLLKQALNKDA